MHPAANSHVDRTIDSPKVVGGHTPTCLEAEVALYRAAFEQVVPVSYTSALSNKLSPKRSFYRKGD